MQPSAAPVICFSWREIAATGRRRRRSFYETGGYRTTVKSNDGKRAFKGALAILAHKDKSEERRGYHSLLRVGGKLPGSERLVHGYLPGSMRFSYR